MQQAGNTSVAGKDGSASSGVSGDASSGSLLLRAFVQVSALSLALAALLLWPAHLSGRLATQPWRVAASYGLYLAFFSSGTLVRMLRYGDLVPAGQDKQRAAPASRLSLFLFAAVAVPAGHFAAFWENERTLRLLSESLAAAAAAAGLPQAAPSSAAAAAAAAAAACQWLVPAVGHALMLSAWALNFAAATALGKAFDRLVAPQRLVTTGPYAAVQHPLYTSYMCLFVGNSLSLGSLAAAAFLLTACLLHYRGRTALEEQLLAGSFGDQYHRYHARTGRFLPRLPLQRADWEP